METFSRGWITGSRGAIPTVGSFGVVEMCSQEYVRGDTLINSRSGGVACGERDDLFLEMPLVVTRESRNPFTAQHRLAPSAAAESENVVRRRFIATPTPENTSNSIGDGAIHMARL